MEEKKQHRRRFSCSDDHIKMNLCSLYDLDQKVINILIIKKPNDEECFKTFQEVLKALNSQNYQKMIHILLDENTVNEQYQNYEQIDNYLQQKNQNQQNDKCYIFEKFNENSKIDLLITIGGDGTILWAIKLFKNTQAPPIFAISKGTLGFMCNYDFETSVCELHKTILNIIEKKQITVEQKLMIKGQLKIKNQQIIEFQSLNEIISKLNNLKVDRGGNPTACQIDIYLNNSFLTSTIGDGLIVCTPNGSTAYGLSAGGPIIHPFVKGIMIIPICAHSLSFRPIILPHDVEIKLKISTKSRNNGVITCDGVNQGTLSQNDELIIKVSEFNAKIIFNENNIAFENWIQKLKRLLNWNAGFMKL